MNSKPDPGICLFASARSREDFPYRSVTFNSESAQRMRGGR